MLDNIINFLYLFFYFLIRKRYDKVVDLHVPIWRATLEKQDIDRYVISFHLDNIEEKCLFMVVGVGTFGKRVSNDVSLILLRKGSHKPLTDCNFKEFLNIYGDSILYLRDEGRSMDIYGR